MACVCVLFCVHPCSSMPACVCSTGMCACVCVCVFVLVQVCVHVCACLSVYRFVCVCTSVCVIRYVCLCVCCVYIQVCVCVYKYACACVCVCACVCARGRACVCARVHLSATVVNGNGKRSRAMKWSAEMEKAERLWRVASSSSSTTQCRHHVATLAHSTEHLGAFKEFYITVRDMLQAQPPVPLRREVNVLFSTPLPDTPEHLGFLRSR